MLTRNEKTTYLFNRKFGVEIEVEGLDTYRTASILTSNIFNRDLKDSKGRTWKVVYDGSLDNGAEVVSPLLTLEDLPILKNLLWVLRNNGAYVDLNTGLHIHVDSSDLNATDLVNLVRLVYARAQLFYRAVRLQRGVRYCKPLEKVFVEEITKSKILDIVDLRHARYKAAGTSGRSHYDDSRYHLLNLHSYFEGKGVEFRLFDGTLIYDKLESYIIFCLALVDYVTKVRSCRIIEPQLDNPKYAMRTFLTRQGKNGLNLKGSDFKTLREVLIEHLDGDAAFRHPEDRNGRWVR